MSEEFFKTLKELKVDYAQTFGTPQGERTLKDLEKNCFYHSTTYLGDKEATLINEGARRVILAIKNMINMPVEKLAADYKRRREEHEGG
jgi:hypothetical protein